MNKLFLRSSCLIVFLCITSNASSDEMHEAAREAGMRTMLVDGMMKVRDGVTTPSEVLKKVFALS